MPQHTRTAIIAGASGLSGRHLLLHLIADARYTAIHALVRKPVLDAHPKLIEHVVDYDHLPALPNVDDVYCCLGTTIKKAGSQEAFRRVDFDCVMSLANAARRADAKRFLVISALGASATSPAFYNRVKAEMESALQSLGFQLLAIFRPSFLLGERSESRPGERIGIGIFQAVGPLLLGPARKYRAIHVDDVAKAMISVAWQDARGTKVYLSDAMQRLADQTPG
jgi:uncharacterized protein YbjT (DUF2867 family)